MSNPIPDSSFICRWIDPQKSELSGEYDTKKRTEWRKKRPISTPSPAFSRQDVEEADDFGRVSNKLTYPSSSETASTYEHLLVWPKEKKTHTHKRRTKRIKNLTEAGARNPQKDRASERASKISSKNANLAERQGQGRRLVAVVLDRDRPDLAHHRRRVGDVRPLPNWKKRKKKERNRSSTSAIRRTISKRARGHAGGTSETGELSGSDAPEEGRGRAPDLHPANGGDERRGGGGGETKIEAVALLSLPNFLSSCGGGGGDIGDREIWFRSWAAAAGGKTSKNISAGTVSSGGARQHESKEEKKKGKSLLLFFPSFF